MVKLLVYKVQVYRRPNVRDETSSWLSISCLHEKSSWRQDAWFTRIGKIQWIHCLNRALGKTFFLQKIKWKTWSIHFFLGNSERKCNPIPSNTLTQLVVCTFIKPLLPVDKRWDNIAGDQSSWLFRTVLNCTVRGEQRLPGVTVGSCFSVESKNSVLPWMRGKAGVHMWNHEIEL